MCIRDREINRLVILAHRNTVGFHQFQHSEKGGHQFAAVGGGKKFIVGHLPRSIEFFQHVDDF